MQLRYRGSGSKDALWVLDQPDISGNCPPLSRGRTGGSACQTAHSLKRARRSVK